MKKKKFKIYGSTEIGWTKIIEANSHAEAIEEAEELSTWFWDSLSDTVEIDDGGSTFISEVELYKLSPSGFRLKK